jgi:hypothetical protein
MHSEENDFTITYGTYIYNTKKAIYESHSLLPPSSDQTYYIHSEMGHEIGLGFAFIYLDQINKERTHIAMCGLTFKYKLTLNRKMRTRKPRLEKQIP